jgi:hypothetical protein
MSTGGDDQGTSRRRPAPPLSQPGGNIFLFLGALIRPSGRYCCSCETLGDLWGSEFQQDHNERL